MTDNGSNILKAVRLLKEKSQEQCQQSTDDLQAQPGGTGDGLDELWNESESEETDQEDEETGESGDLGECGDTYIY